jgi:hypothetical protein
MGQRGAIKIKKEREKIVGPVGGISAESAYI